MSRIGGLLLACLCALALTAPAAQAVEPTIFYASLAKEGQANGPYPPPGSGLEGPCGIAVDANGAFYVADYHHHAVDGFSSARKYLTQASGLGPEDGPCGLAVDPAGDLYVNDYHQGVARLTPSLFPLTATATYGPPAAIASVAHATGLALDPASGSLYVDERTRIGVYDSSGALIETIGQGAVADGYGLALSQHPASAGHLYLADAADNTVKVFDPLTDTANPVAVIDGTEIPSGQFTSLRDAALAVDRVSGEIYVADNLQPTGFERPEATIQVFKADGSYEGHLPVNVIDARPPGLAVDNSAKGTQGRVYVTSGNSEGAAVHIYPSGSATAAAPICAPGGACPPAPVSSLAASAGGAPARAAASTAFSAGPSAALQKAGAGGAAIVQKGTLRVALDGKLAPQKLPRAAMAPVAISVSGRVSTTDASTPPQLQALAIELNRHGRLDLTGLPTCPYGRIQPASSSRALNACRSALVGQGRFEADITLAGQEPYPTQGKLLVFNGRRAGKPVLFGQIYAPKPFATSFVIVFAIKRIAGGTYGTKLTAELPEALGNWGNLTAIEMRLARSYIYRGRAHSFLSASCPAPAGFPGATFSLARTSFRFAAVGELSSTLIRSCGVR